MERCQVVSLTAANATHTRVSRISVTPRFSALWCVCVCVWVRSRCVPRFDTLNFSHDSFDKLWARPVSYKNIEAKAFMHVEHSVVRFLFQAWVGSVLTSL